jgi:hypothetical protein
MNESTAMIRILVVVWAIFALISVGCRKNEGSTERVQRELVGRWKGMYANPSASGKAGRSMEFEFEFQNDGRFKMGKGKVWVEGSYRMFDSASFELQLKAADTIPYRIVELTERALIFERNLPEGGVQRTELTRIP